MLPKKIIRFIYLIVKPLSQNEDLKRREFILNVLLFGSIVLSAIATISSFVHLVTQKSGYIGNPPIFLFSICIIFLILYILSRRGFFILSSYILIGIYLIPSIYAIYTWSIYITEAILIFALIIIMSGILITTRFAFIISLICCFIILLLTYLQQHSIIHANLSWEKNLSPEMGNALVFVFTLLVVMIVSWLSNREIEKSLKRARKSETALQKQKGQLEILVEERTQELKHVQAEKLAQLYRFAEFGRMASGLFHDLVNPLELVSLNLDRLNEKSKKMNQQEIKKLLDRAMIGMKQLEDFVLTARKQMQHQKVLQVFSMTDEIIQVIQILTYKAKKAHIHISFSKTKDIQLFGNAIKFDQLITNLITNAIDSYETDTKNDKRIEIYLQETNQHARLTVQDWGSGIQKKHLSKIFDPLFTTKSFEKGTGMGLAICKDIMKKDFKGEIQVTSTENKGTTFTLIFPIKKS